MVLFRGRGERLTFRIRLGLVLVGLAVAGVLLTLLYHFSPEQPGRWPMCPLYALTGLHCPGCGSTRCVYWLLHLNIPQALAYNLPLVVLSPYLAWWLGRKTYYYLRGAQPPHEKPLPRWAVISLVAVIYLYGIARNIPVEPFTYLAPHRLDSTGAGD